MKKITLWLMIRNLKNAIIKQEKETNSIVKSAYNNEELFGVEHEHDECFLQSVNGSADIEIYIIDPNIVNYNPYEDRC